MDLKEIREAYAEIIGGYNEIFPVHPATTKKAMQMKRETSRRGMKIWQKQLECK